MRETANTFRILVSKAEGDRPLVGITWINERIIFKRNLKK
jgi:hypothetical protein